MSPSLASPRSRPARIAIVGSGPSGFYTAAALFKQNEQPIEVDFFDRLPTPYGLVRGGVAPDHQNIKAVIRVYDKLARRDELHFFGNVMVGRDLSLDELRGSYDQVVIAAGNESHRRMEIPGEDLRGVYSATAFVGWYNGHPDYRGHEFPLGTAKRVAVVGNGNVAMDVTRVLAKRAERLAATDIASHALEALAKSAVEEIHVLGRRGPAEAAFTAKEVKEIGSLDDADLVVAPRDAELDAESARWLAEKGTPGAKRNAEYLLEKSRESPRGLPRRVHFRFLVSPIEFLGKDGELEAIKLERNELYLDSSGTPRPRGTGETWIEPFQLALTAVGYRGVPIPGCPFDERGGIVPNAGGKADRLRRRHAAGSLCRGLGQARSHRPHRRQCRRCRGDGATHARGPRVERRRAARGRPGREQRRRACGDRAAAARARRALGFVRRLDPARRARGHARQGAGQDPREVLEHRADARRDRCRALPLTKPAHTDTIIDAACMSGPTPPSPPRSSCCST